MGHAKAFADVRKEMHSLFTSGRKIEKNMAALVELHEQSRNQRWSDEQATATAELRDQIRSLHGFSQRMEEQIGSFAELREQVRGLKEIGTQNRDRYDASANVAQDYGDVAVLVRTVLEELNRTGLKSDIDYL